MECLHEMYQVIAFNEYINTEILKEKYNEELISNGQEPIYEGVGESIKEGFKKVIEVLKKIIEKIINFVTVTIPGIFKKFAACITNLVSKKDKNKATVDVSKLPEKEQAKVEAVATACNAASKAKHKVAVATTIAAVSSDVKNDKVTTPSKDNKSTQPNNNQEKKSNEEKIKDARLEVDKLEKKAKEKIKEIIKDCTPEVKAKVQECEKAMDKEVQIEIKTPKKVWIGRKGVFYNINEYNIFFKSYEYIIGKINHHVQLGVYNLGDIQDIITSNLDKKQEEEEFFSITRKLEKKIKSSREDIENVKKYLDNIDKAYLQLSKSLSLSIYNVNCFYTQYGKIDDLKKSADFAKYLKDLINETHNDYMKAIDNPQVQKFIISNYMAELALWSQLISKFTNKLTSILVEINKNVLYFNANATDVYREK